MKSEVKGSATLKLDFPSGKSAHAARAALAAEADFSHRGGSSVSLLGRSVIVRIKADDLVSLRASINSYLRLMHIIKAIEQDSP